MTKNLKDKMVLYLPFEIKPFSRPRLGKGRTYQPKQMELINSFKKYKFENSLSIIEDTKLSVRIFVSYQDNRRRDIDNIAKGILDALMDAKIIDDDSNVFDLRVVKKNKQAISCAFVEIDNIIEV